MDIHADHFACSHNIAVSDAIYFFFAGVEPVTDADTQCNTVSEPVGVAYAIRDCFAAPDTFSHSEPEFDGDGELDAVWNIFANPDLVSVVQRDSVSGADRHADDVIRPDGLEIDSSYTLVDFIAGVDPVAGALGQPNRKRLCLAGAIPEPNANAQRDLD